MQTYYYFQFKAAYIRRMKELLSSDNVNPDDFFAPWDESDLDLPQPGFQGFGFGYDI